jgi:hypothetical protein
MGKIDQWKLMGISTNFLPNCHLIWAIQLISLVLKIVILIKKINKDFRPTDTISHSLHYLSR